MRDESDIGLALQAPSNRTNVGMRWCCPRDMAPCVRKIIRTLPVSFIKKNYYKFATEEIYVKSMIRHTREQ